MATCVPRRGVSPCEGAYSNLKIFQGLPHERDCFVLLLKKTEQGSSYRRPTLALCVGGCANNNARSSTLRVTCQCLALHSILKIDDSQSFQGESDDVSLQST